MYPSETAFHDALRSYGVTADELTRRLWWQLTLLRFIDYRFRPGIQIPAADVQAYYRQQVSQWEQKGTKPIPTLEESRDQIEEILTQQRIDQALDQWIKDTRNQVTITLPGPGAEMTSTKSADCRRDSAGRQTNQAWRQVVAFSLPWCCGPGHRAAGWPAWSWCKPRGSRT